MASTRKTVRERLASLLTTRAQFNVVYGYAPIDLQGFDKVLCIFSDSTRHDQMTKDWVNNLYTFTLDVYIKRASGETTEDTLDNMHDELRDFVRDNQGDSVWDFLDLNETSDAYFAEVSGVPYRIERHRLTVKVSG
jgi:hypothetical protein